MASLLVGSMYEKRYSTSPTSPCATQGKDRDSSLEESSARDCGYTRLALMSGVSLALGTRAKHAVSPTRAVKMSS